MASLAPRAGLLALPPLLALAGCATRDRPVVSLPESDWGYPTRAEAPAAAPTASARTGFYEPPAPDPATAPPADRTGGLLLDPDLADPPVDPATARSPAEARRLAREQDVSRLLGAFSLAGKVSVAASSLPANAEIAWVQQGNDFDMHLIGAFGAGATRLSSQDGTVTLRTRGGEFVTTDPEADLRERLGYAVPVNGLRYWALGLPMPTRPPADALFDAVGHPVRYRQGAWTVEYADWRVTDGHDLPRRLEAHTATADGRDEARFRLAITAWTFGAPVTLPDVEPTAEDGGVAADATTTPSR